MTIYNLIYDFFYSIIGLGYGTDAYFALDELYFVVGAGDTSITMNDWLCHTFTIISIVLIFIFLIIFIKWLFKLFGGLFKW